MIDLTPFCDKEQSRYALQKPWRVGDKVIASDGRIIVEIDSQLAPDIDEPEYGQRVPRHDAIFAPFALRTDWRPFPQWDDCHCNECQGTGLLRCKRCNGSGGCCCECGDEHDCHECAGEGYKKRSRCPACAILFGGEWFAASYMRSIRALPNVLIDSRDDKLLFKFDGGRGVLVSMVKESDV